MALAISRRNFILLFLLFGFMEELHAAYPFPLDLVVSPLIRSDQSLSAAALYQGIDVKFNFDVVITNEDVNHKYQKVYQQIELDNFDVRVLMVDYDPLTTEEPAETLTKTFDATLTLGTEGVVKQEIISGRSVTVRGSAIINIEASKCLALTHLCVEIVVNDNPSVIIDNNPFNNFACANLVDWGLLGCTEDTVDLRASVFDVMMPVVESGAAITVELLLDVELRGTARSNPFAVHAYLCTSDSLDPSRDKQLPLLPAAFEQTQTELTTSQTLDLSTPGLWLPPLHQSVEDSKYCGAVNLAILIDGPGLGANNETHEDNNIMIVRMTILCPTDYLSIKDFQYDLGQNQSQLYIDTDTPLNVNVTVYNSRFDRIPFYYGRANFMFQLFLHTSEELLRSDGTIDPGALNVSMRGITYPLGVTPIEARDTREYVRIELARMYINKTRFKEYRPFTHLILLTLPPEGSLDADGILRNNYISLPVAVSDSRITSSLKDHKISDDFGVPAEILPIYEPVPYADLAFTGHIIVGKTVSGTMMAELFWSKDGKWDKNDPPSGVETTIEVDRESMREIKPKSMLQQAITVPIPQDKSYCNTIYCIITFHSSDYSDDILERNRENQFGKDLATLQCDPTDILGLVELWIEEETLTKNVETPITFTATYSCNSLPCPNSQVKFHLELLIDSGPNQQESLVTLTSNTQSDIVSYSKNGLETSFGPERRVRMTFTVMVTVTGTCLSRTQYFGVRIINPGGPDWEENNYLVVPLPLMRCVKTNAIDIEAGELILHPQNGEVRTTQAIPYQFSFRQEVIGEALPEQRWPHFRIAAVVSGDRKLDDRTYYLLSYRTPDEHRHRLRQEFPVGIKTTDLEDLGGLVLPANGLERFCHPTTGVATVYIGLFLDSYDPDPGDWIIGQLAELLEYNNVAWTSSHVNVTGVKCNLNSVVEKKLYANVRKMTLNSGTSNIEIPAVLASSAMTFHVEVGIENAYSEVLVQADGSTNFDIRLAVSVPGGNSADIIIQNSIQVLLLRKAPIEAGATLVFTVKGILCPSAGSGKGCGLSNVLLADVTSLDGCIVHDDGFISVFFIRDPPLYTTQSGDKQCLVICSGELYMATILYLGVPAVMWGSGASGQGTSPDYGFPFIANITRYAVAPPDAVSTQQGDFYFRFVKNGSLVLLTKRIPISMTIAPGGSMQLSGIAILSEELDDSRCVKLTGSVDVQAIVARSTGRKMPGWLQLDDLNSQCSEEEITNFVDVAVTNIIINETKVQLGQNLQYSLEVSVDDRANSGNTSFTLDLYLSLGTNLSYTHARVETFSGNGTTEFTSETGFQLNIAGERLAWFCAYRDIYFMAHAYKNDPLPVDPAPMRNIGTSPISLYCHGDLLELLKVDHLTEQGGTVPLYYTQGGYVNIINMVITVRNSDFLQRALPASHNGHPNWAVEMYYKYGGGRWNTLMEVEVVRRDRPLLRAAIPINGSISVEVSVTIQVTTALCDLLSGNGRLQVAINQGLGLPLDWSDSVLSNNAITYSVRCTPDFVDLFLQGDSLSIFDGILPHADVFTHFAERQITFTIYANISNGQSMTMDSSNLDYKLYISRDKILDVDDLQLTLGSLTGTQYGTLSDDPLSPEPDAQVAFGTASSNIVFPLEVISAYCGRVYLLMTVNSDRPFNEPNWINNMLDVPFTVICKNDLYSFWDGETCEETAFYPDKPTQVCFRGTVLNVDSANPILPHTQNFIFKVYAQRGNLFKWGLAADITPTLEFMSNEAAQANVYQDFATELSFTRITGTLTIPRGVCAEGADHLFYGVMAKGAGFDDSVLYDNFFVHPITIIKHPEMGCSSQDSVDLRVKRYRNLETTFAIADTDLTIGTEYSFQLEIQIEINGEGWKPYWQSLPVEGKPVFNVIFTLADSLYTLIIPHTVDYTRINDQITSTTTIDLGGVLVLPPGGAVPFCGEDNLDLSVILDSNNRVAETNEANNKETITGISVLITSQVCGQGKFDLVVTDLTLLPLPNEWLVVNNSNMEPSMFSVTIEVCAENVVSLPSTLSYAFVLSATGSPLDTVPAQNGRIHVTDTLPITSKVFNWIGNVTVETGPANDGPVSVLCGTRPYLGFHLDPLQEVEELDEDITNYAFQQILLNCPLVHGIALVGVVIKEPSLSDIPDVSLTIGFHLINKGEVIDTLNGYQDVEISLYARADTVLPAENDLGDRFYVLNPDLNLRQGYDANWGTSENRWYPDVEFINITFPAAKCTEAEFLCFFVRLIGSPNETLQDNYQCVPFDDNFHLDCVRDIALHSVEVQLVDTAAIYQDTRVPVTFTAVLTFMGRPIAASSNGQSHVGVKFYLSNNGTLEEAEDPLLADLTQTLLDVPLNSSLTSGNDYPISGHTEVFITHAHCVGDVFLCARYVFLSTLSPVFKESALTRGNDVDCIEVTDKVACNNETTDIVPILFEPLQTWVNVGGSLKFDLVVAIDLRGETTAGHIAFNSAIYVSFDDKLDANDQKIPYVGWEAGLARRELARVLPAGKHYLNLGGIPLTLPDLPDPTYCGRVFLLCNVDDNFNVSERYEDNNVIAAPIVVCCEGDVVGETEMVDLLYLTNVTLHANSPLAAGMDTVVYVSADLYNVGPPLTLPSPSQALYVLTLETDTGVVLTLDDGWLGYPDDFNAAMSTGQRHKLWNLQVVIAHFLFTEEVCTSMIGLRLCAKRPEPKADEVKPTVETYLENNCYDIPSSGFTKDCAASGHVDIQQTGLQVPDTFSLSDMITVSQDVIVIVGPDGEPIRESQFISALYLSVNQELNRNTAHYLATIPNNIGALVDTRQSVRITLSDATLAPPSDPAAGCGLAYVHVMADSKDEVLETREDNNLGSQLVTLTCDMDFFAILDLEIVTPEGRFVEDSPVDFRVEVKLTCSRSNCLVVPALSSNVKFDLLYRNTDVTPGVVLAMVDENWFGDVTPGVDVGFNRPGLIRTFVITGNLTLPTGACLPDQPFYVGVRVSMGTDLIFQTDDVMSNNILFVPYLCNPGLNALDSRDLVAMSLTFINSSVEHGPELPAIVRAGHIYHFSLDFRLVGAPLPVRDSAVPDSPFLFQFYLSLDDKWDEDDLSLGYELTNGNAATLSKPIGVTPAVLTVLENVKGIRFPEGVCGLRQLLVYIDSTNRVPEVSERNNVAARPVFIVCRQDLFSLLNLTLESGPLWLKTPPTPQTVRFDVTIMQSGPHRLVPIPGRVPLEVQAYLSQDTTLEDFAQPGDSSDGPSTDGQDLNLGQATLLPAGRGLLMKPLEAGEVFLLEDLTVEVTLEDAACEEGRPLYNYLLVNVRPLYVPYLDSQFANNYQAVGIHLNCQDATEIEVAIGAGSILSSQSEVKVTLTVDVKGPLPSFFVYAIYISVDQVLDDDDLILSVPAAGEAVVGPDPAVQAVNVLEGDVRLPAVLDYAYCGIVYLIGKVVPGKLMDGSTGEMIVGTAETTVACPVHDLMALVVNHIVNPAPTADLNLPYQPRLRITVHCRDQGICTKEATVGQNLKLVFRLYDWEKVGLTTLIPAEVDELNGAMYLSNPEVLTGEYSAFKARSTDTVGDFVVTDAELCPLVRYLGVTLLKGDSLEVRAKDLGPWASKTRFVPLTVNCHPRSIDLAVEYFGYIEGNAAINIGAGTIPLVLDVSITSNNWPMRESYDTLFSYRIFVKVADDPTLNIDDIDYVPSKPIISLLTTGLATMQLDLTDFAGTAAWSNLMSLCGRSDVTLGVFIDSYDNYVETNETNNEAIAEGFVQIINCTDGVDVEISRFDLKDPVVSSGVALEGVDVDVRVVTVGPFPPKGIVLPDTMYALDFALVNSMTDITEEIPLPLKLDEPLLDPEVNMKSPADTPPGLAVVWPHKIEEIKELPIPTDVALCDRAWYVRARVKLLIYPGKSWTEADLYPGNNVQYKHLTIRCPLDNLALLSVEIVKLPIPLWYDSYQRLYFRVNVINKGAAMPWPQDELVYLFTVTLLFSASDDIAAAETEVILAMHGDYGFDYRGPMGPLGDVYQSDVLYADINIATQMICNKARTGEGSNPTLFFILEEGNSDSTSYKGNDVLTTHLDPATLICNQNNVDLSLFSVAVGVSNSRTILVGENTSITVLVGQTHSLGGYIPFIPPLDPGVSMAVTLYLSTDDKLDSYDDELTFNYNPEQYYTLKRGVQPNSASIIVLDGTNLNIDIRKNVELSFYCGWCYLVAKVSDLIYGNSQDPVPENNVHAIPVNLVCPQDIISFEKLDVTPLEGQVSLYPGAYTDFHILAKIAFNIPSYLPDSDDERLNFYFKVFMSPDRKLDTKHDPEIEAVFNWEIIEAAREGFPAWTTRTYRGIVRLHTNLIVCVFRPQFLIVQVLPGAQIPYQEFTLYNNYEYINAKKLLDCSISTTDIYVLNFALTSDHLLHPGEQIDFDLSVRVDLTGSAALGASAGDQFIFKYQFYLSKDRLVSEDDLNLRYSMVDYQTDMKTRISTGVSVFTLNAIHELLAIPEDIMSIFCGRGYIVAFLDDGEEVEEKDEANNQFSVPVILLCPRDFYSIENVSIELQPWYFRAPGFIEMNLTVTSLTNDTSLIPPGDDAMNFRLYVRDPASGRFLHDVTPDGPWTIEGTAVNLTSRLEVGETRTFLNMRNSIDMSSVCMTLYDPLKEGVNRLVVIVNPGGPENVPGLWDGVADNNQYSTPIHISCSPEYFDLFVATFNFLNPPNVVTTDLQFGNNVFDLQVEIYTPWRFPAWAPSELPLPQQMDYDFKLIFHVLQVLVAGDTPQNVVHVLPIPYNTSVKKDTINKPYTNGMTIDLKDISGLQLPIEDFCVICLASSIELMVTIDTKHQQNETNEANNEFTLSNLTPPPNCQGIDLRIRKFSIPGLTYDILSAEVAVNYVLDIDVIQLTSIDNLIPSASEHFHLQFFLSGDNELKTGVINFSVPLSTTQINALKAGYSGWDLMSLSGSGLTVPLTKDTYALCWRTAYVGVRLDATSQVIEVSADNNVALYAVIFDCGDKLDECSRGLAACDHSALCHDKPFSLDDTRGGYLSVGAYSSRTSPKFQCECNAGYIQANVEGTLCEDIAECTELGDDGDVLHNCDPAKHLTCVEQNGNFSCICIMGFTMENGLCQDFDECENASYNNCHENASCINTLGSFSCICLPGFEGNGLTCEDIDDCQINSCVNNGICIDGVDSFSCKCAPFTSGPLCEQVNGNWGQWGEWGNCDAYCGPGLRKRYRECNDPMPSGGGCGCAISGDISTKMTDICIIRSCLLIEAEACLFTPCPLNSRSYIGRGGFCGCECLWGYKFNTDTGFCDDIDECSELTPKGVPVHDCCDPNGRCENTYGNFLCVCLPGFEFVGSLCVNIDECSIPDTCSNSSETCVDVPGSYNCVCKPGFQQRSDANPCRGERMYSYGPEAGDTRLNTTTRLTDELVSEILPVRHGIPMADKLLYGLYISENGVVVGTEQHRETDYKDAFKRPQPLTSLYLPTDRQVEALIAVFWADAKLNFNDSAVWYQNYTDQSLDIFSYVDQLMVSLGVSGFTPSYILKVTWLNLRPHYLIPNTSAAHTDQVNNFQAFVVTDSAHTYVICVYEDSAMTWFPEYSHREVVQIYEGYPAWVGFVAKGKNGTTERYQDVNSGHWNNDLLPSSLNAYRMDNRQLKPLTSGRVGVTMMRLDTNSDDYHNPGKSCYLWAQMEPNPVEWAFGLLGGCPDVMAQAEEDPRFMEVLDAVAINETARPDLSVDPNVRCFTKLFSLHGGGNIQCCYRNRSGAMIGNNMCRPGTNDPNYSSLGLIHRYNMTDEPNSTHQLMDVQPYRWCCLEAPSDLEEDYGQMYLNKRPAASSTNYDRFLFALFHGDPHYVTFDGQRLTLDGVGEFVVLRSHDPQVMIQVRQNKEAAANSSAEIKRTYISAVAVRVGDQSEPSLQVYMRRDRPERPLEVVVGTTEWTEDSPNPKNVIISRQDDPLIGQCVQFVFRLELVMRVCHPDNRLRVVVMLPESLINHHWEGILGMPDYNMQNDMKPFTTGGDALPLDPDSSGDIKYIFGLSWALPYVFGAHGDATSTANNASLFSRYGNNYIRISAYQTEILAADEFVDGFFSPNFYTCTDATDAERVACNGTDPVSYCECLHEVRATGDPQYGRRLLDSIDRFNQLKMNLSNQNPEFAPPTPKVIYINESESFSVPITFRDVDDNEVTLTYSLKDTDGRELLVSQDPAQTGVVVPNTGVFVGSVGQNFSFTLSLRLDTPQPVLLEFTATDSKGATTVFRPLLVLCQCENEGRCDQEYYKVLTEGFALAACQCNVGWAGEFCELDFAGCNTTCYQGCEDVKAKVFGGNYSSDSQSNYTSDSQFVCDPCPAGTENYSNICSRINECILVKDDPRADLCDQACLKLGDPYTCSCGPGYDLDPVLGFKCLDHPECASPYLNDCDKVNGFCKDHPEGSYTCYCNAGFQLIPDSHLCEDVDECQTYNGGCEGTCINNQGSFTCKCPPGTRINQNNPRLCLLVNECLEGIDLCDHECADTAMGYECSCKAGFILQTDNTSCRAEVPCVSTQCGNMAFCADETCFCPTGYRLTVDGVNCEDINQCSHGIDMCDVRTSTCLNIPGLYECQCHPGYQHVNGDNFICENVDECTENTEHGCPILCHDTPGSYRCECPQGYILLYDNGNWSCEDVDECSQGHLNPCDPHADCINMIGQYSCECRQGYIGNGATCTEYLDCALSNGGCQLSCRDVADSYVCECIDGYQKDRNDTTRCYDINECEWPENPCTHICTNTPGSYFCSCRDSFILDGDLKTCLPESPCTEDCGNGVCYRTSDGEKRCDCYSGYKKHSGSLDECMNVNECMIQADKCLEDDHTTCVDQSDGPGGYKCQCDLGYTAYGDELSCHDIDECSTQVPEHKHACDLKVSTCVNHAGGYDCVCFDGYTPGDNKTCVDVDECARWKRTRCDEMNRTDCANIPGGYLCQCKPGYRGDGFTCQDIDECLYDSCGEHEDCYNTIGSYRCFCAAGYQNKSEGCIDIDECLSATNTGLNKCRRKELCENTPGSYRCHCYTGGGREQLQNDGHTCTVLRPCLDDTIGEGCDGTCLNGYHGDKCLCGWPLTNYCEDIDECKYNDTWCDLIHNKCINMPHGYACPCLLGWIPDPDGRGCSETNGLWSDWSPWSNCSNECMGTQTRNRSCSDPPPVGPGRYCHGESNEYEICNTEGTAYCSVLEGELKGVFIDFHDMESWQYQSIEDYFYDAIAIVINLNVKGYSDNNTYHIYSLLCGGVPSDGVVPDMNLVKPSEIRLGRAYPRRVDNTTRILVNVAKTMVPTFCNSSTNYTAPPLSDDVSSNDTSYEPEVDDFLSCEILLAALNMSQLYDILDEILYDAQLHGNMDAIFPLKIMCAYDPRPPTTTPPPVVVEKEPEIPFWVYIVIGILLVLLIIVVALLVYFLVIKKKKHKHARRCMSPVHPVTGQPLTEEQKRLVRQRVRERRLRERQLHVAEQATLETSGGGQQQDGVIEEGPMDVQVAETDGAELSQTGVAPDGGEMQDVVSAQEEEGQKEEGQKGEDQIEKEEGQEEQGEKEEEEKEEEEEEEEEEEDEEGQGEPLKGEEEQEEQGKGQEEQEEQGKGQEEQDQEGQDKEEAGQQVQDEQAQEEQASDPVSPVGSTCSIKLIDERD